MRVIMRFANTERYDRKSHFDPRRYQCSAVDCSNRVQSATFAFASRRAAIDTLTDRKDLHATAMSALANERSSCQASLTFSTSHVEITSAMSGDDITRIGSNALQLKWPVSLRDRS